MRLVASADTAHRPDDVALMNDAHRRSLCAGMRLDSGRLDFRDPYQSSRDDVLRAVALSASVDSADHGSGTLVVDHATWCWRFWFFEDASLGAEADPYVEQTYRVLVVERVLQKFSEDWGR